MSKPIHSVFKNTCYDPDYIIPEWNAPFEAPIEDAIKALIDKAVAGDLEAFQTLKSKHKNDIPSRLLRRGGLDALAAAHIEDPHERFAFKFDAERLQTMMAGNSINSLELILIEQTAHAYASLQIMETKLAVLEAAAASEPAIGARAKRVDSARKALLQTSRTLYHIKKPQY